MSEPARVERGSSRAPTAPQLPRLPQLTPADVAAMSLAERRVLQWQLQTLIIEAASLVRIIDAAMYEELVAAAEPSSLHPVDVYEAARILGVGEGEPGTPEGEAGKDWVQHRGHEADEFGAAIRTGGSRISGYDVAGLLRWRRARTANAERWVPAVVPRSRKGSC